MNEKRKLTTDELSEIKSILEKCSIKNTEKVWRFVDTKLDKVYDVYFLEESKIILKKCGKGRDIIKYDKYFAGKDFNIPKIFNRFEADDKKYVTMEYIDGTDARNCSMEQAELIGKELGRIQNFYLTAGGHNERTDNYFKKEIYDNFEKVKEYAPYLKDIFPYVENRFFNAPQTLIHDDLLPINVFLAENKPYIIDWEYCDILPYFLDLGRFAYVFNEKGELFVQKPSSDRFLDKYYDEMCKNADFKTDRKQFNADVAVSAFCQYIIFTSSCKSKDEFDSSHDSRILEKISQYIKNLN